MSEVFAFVPSYNHAPYVERCLKSIVKQTLPPKKLLVIDDGSTDDSVQIIEKFLRACPIPAEFIKRENRGLCRTLNEGFANCDAEFFAYLGSDDVWLPEFLTHRTATLKNRPAAVLAYGHSFTIDADDEIIDCSAEWADFPDGDARSMLLRGNAPFSPTVVYRSAALENLRWNENARLEDYDFYLRLSEKGEFAFDPQILAAWRQHGANTSDDWTFMLDEILAAQRRNAVELGLDEKSLAQIRTATELLHSENLARSGDKLKALALLVKNLRQTDSTKSAAKSFLRILTPMPMLRRYRKKTQRRARMKYGKVQILTTNQLCAADCRID